MYYLLSENRFLLADLGYHNSLFNKKDKQLYMVDPGRYHHQSLFTISDYKRCNQMMLSEYFKHMLKCEMFYFKLVNKNKIPLILDNIENELDGKRYSDYFEKNVTEYDSIHEFLKIKSRFLK